jgi:DNA ligase-1
VEIFSRNLERMTSMFPDIVKAIKENISAKTVILEGEAVAFNEETGELFPFQVTITRKRKYDIEEKAKEKPLVLFAFDLLYADGKDITGEAYEERRKRLVGMIKKGFTIRESERIVTDDPKELEKYFEESIELGSEGIMAKRLDAPYEAGMRNFNWIKLKRSYKGELNDTIDVVLIGYFKGRGMRAAFGIGALLAAVYDEKKDCFQSIAKIGSGLTEERWVEIRKLLDKSKVEKKPARVETGISPDVWTAPKYIFTVMADEITLSPMHAAGKIGEKPGFALRFPRVQGWIREDKKPEDATSVKEISEMFKMQKRVKATSFGR